MWVNKSVNPSQTSTRATEPRKRVSALRARSLPHAPGGSLREPPPLWRPLLRTGCAGAPSSALRACVNATATFACSAAVRRFAPPCSGPGQRRGFNACLPLAGGAAQASCRASLQGALRARFARPFARSLRAAASVAPLVCHAILHRDETPPAPFGARQSRISAKAPPPPGGRLW